MYILDVKLGVFWIIFCNARDGYFIYKFRGLFELFFGNEEVGIFSKILIGAMAISDDDQSRPKVKTRFFICL